MYQQVPARPMYGVPGPGPLQGYPQQVSMSPQPDARLPRPSTQLREISLEYSYAELSTSTKCWHASRRLGSGSYGAVFKGELEDGSEVAIKAIDLQALGAAGTSPEMSGFEEEVQMLSKFRHPNLVTLLGWGKHNLNRYLVYELLAGGDCFQRLQKSKKPGSSTPFYWFERLSVFLDAATGLSHMHNSKPKAFHRDIKSANILLDRHGTAKMADFGLSCTSNRSDSLHVTVRTISGTPGYACPVYSRTGRVTEGSEVYSFGMVMLELLTGLAPATADASRPGGIAYQVQDAVAQHSPGSLERCMRNLDATASWPQALTKELSELSLRAVLAQDEGQRPRFVELVRALRKFTEQYPRPVPNLPATYNMQALPQVPQHLINGPAQGQMAAPQLAQPAQPTPGPKIMRVPSFHEQSTSGKEAPVGYTRPQSATAQPAQARVAAAAAIMQAASGASFAGAVSSTAPTGPTAFHLEFVDACRFDASTLPPECRKVPVAPPETSSSRLLLPVGRLHQQRAFETWVSDEKLRGCISRTAFEVSCGPKGEDAKLTVRGSVPVSVDGKMAPRDVEVSLSPDSEISFLHVDGLGKEPTVMLRLRFHPECHVAGEVREASPVQAAQVTTPAISIHVDDGTSTSSPSKPPASTPTSPSKPPPSHTPTSPSKPPPSYPSSPSKSRSTPPLLKSDPQPSTDDSGQGANSLTCIHAEGLNAKELSDLPGEFKEIHLQTAETHIGRHHQSQFESLTKVAGLPSNLSFISRTHAQIEKSGDGSLSITNMSSNPLYVNRDLVGTRAAQKLSLGQIVSFAREERGQHVHFLKFEVTAAKASSSETNPKMSQKAEAASPEKVRSEAHRADEEQEVISPNPPSRQVTKDKSISPSKVRPSPAAWSQKQEPVEAQEAGMRPAKDNTKVVLELHGQGVLDVASSARRIGPVELADKPLFVGRKHQADLHKRAVSSSCLQFMSRDHFRVSLEAGEFRLLAMTSNPIWRDRDGTEPVELARGDEISLLPGDRIALGTGADVVADSAIQNLCWHFVLDGDAVKAPVVVPPKYGSAESSPVVPEEDGHIGSFGQRTPPSPGGKGPRVSDVAPPWASRGPDISHDESHESSSPARERMLSESGVPKAKAKSRSAV
mmetsp:Transcript_30174/g.54765  ORF Transcript_30174/g.54765 Transcript_30174/m.54765 type:complete len:1127 (+) Transcript_30174:42-3422(+)